MKFISALSAAALAAIAFAPATALADAHSEIVLARTHAGYAAQGNDLKTVDMHLHHTLNCLVGPGGNGFDKTQLNPCAQAGKGAIPDASNPATRAALEAAASQSRTALGETDLAKAKAAAADIAAALKKAE